MLKKAWVVPTQNLAKSTRDLYTWKLAHLIPYFEDHIKDLKMDQLLYPL